MISTINRLLLLAHEKVILLTDYIISTIIRTLKGVTINRLYN